MIKLWLTFALFAVAIHFGITAVRNMSGRDRWTLTKSISYSMIIALLVTLALVTIVVVF